MAEPEVLGFTDMPKQHKLQHFKSFYYPNVHAMACFVSSESLNFTKYCMYVQNCHVTVQ